MVRPIARSQPGGLPGLFGPSGGGKIFSREQAWWAGLLELLPREGKAGEAWKGGEIPDPARALAELLLSCLPYPACLVRSGGEKFAWGPRWEDLERSLGRDPLQLLMARARGACGAGCPKEENFLLQCRGRWFQFSRTAFLGRMDPILWTVKEVTPELGLYFREKAERAWMEETLRVLGSWSGDPRSFARALAGAVLEKTGWETVQVYWKSPSRGVLSLLGGAPDSSGFPGEISLSEKTPLGWVAASGRRKILDPSPPGVGWTWDPLEEMRLRRLLLLPLSSQGQTLGVLAAAAVRFLPLPSAGSLHSLETVCRAASDLLNMGELYRESRASEAEWKRVFFSLDHPLFLLDQEGRVLRANPAAARALDRENPEELTGIPWAELAMGASGTSRGCLVTRTLRTGSSVTAYRNLPRLGGRCLLSVHPLPGPGGEPSGVILFARKVAREEGAGEEGERDEAAGVKELRRQRDMLARFLGAAAGIFRLEDLRDRLLLTCRTIREAGLFRKAAIGFFEGKERRFRVLASLGGSLPEEVLLGEVSGLVDFSGEELGEERFRVGNSFFVPVEARLPGEKREVERGPWKSRGPWREGDLLLVPLGEPGGRVPGLLILEDPFDGMRPSEGIVRALELMARLTLSAVEHSILKEEAGEGGRPERGDAGRKGRWDPSLERGELPRGRGQVILVVDDEEAVLHLLEVFLSYLGYGFLQARSGAEALELLREGREAAGAIVDYTLSGMDGRALAVALKEASPGLPVVLTSGFLPPPGETVPEDAFLAKPFHLEDVAHFLHALVG